MSTRNKILRERAAEQQGERCFYCGFPIWKDDVADFARRFSISRSSATRFQCTAEHVHALGDGGKTSPGNIVAACLFCNKTRHRRPQRVSAEAYLALVRRRLARHRWHPNYFEKLIKPVATNS